MFNKIIILIFLFFVFSSFPAKIIQAADGEATVPSQAFSGAGQAPATTNFFSYVQFLYPFGLSVAAILAVFMLVFAGLQMMASAGNPGLIESAKGRISAAILGLLIAVGSYVILRTINPDLVRLRLTVPTVNVGRQTPVPETGIVTKDELLKEEGQTPVQRATYENIIKTNPGFEGVIRNEKKESPRDFQITAQQKCVSSGGKGVVQNPGKPDEYLCLK